jgi:DNA-binding response OmpR family regulator
MAKILIIEDEANLASVMQFLLTKAGHAVEIAGDGEQGIAMLKANVPDIVITDILMPGKEGFETIREIRDANPNLPIIATSGGGHTENYDFLRVAQTVGATEIIRKPFRNHELVALVDKCLNPA